MTLTKPLAAAAVIVLGLALAEVTTTRHAEDKAQPTVKPHQSVVVGASASDRAISKLRPHRLLIIFRRHSPPSQQVQRAGAMPQYGYRSAPDGYMPGDMSSSIYGSLSPDDVTRPDGLLGARPLVSVSRIWRQSVFMPPPEGVWGR